MLQQTIVCCKIGFAENNAKKIYGTKYNTHEMYFKYFTALSAVMLAVHSTKINHVQLSIRISTPLTTACIHQYTWSSLLNK